MTTVNLTPDHSLPGVGACRRPAEAGPVLDPRFRRLRPTHPRWWRAGALYLVGHQPRQEQRATLYAETAEAIASRPRVQISVPFRRDKPSDLTLPGEIRAFPGYEHFCANGWVRQTLPCGHRRQGRGGDAPGRDRHAGARPGAEAGRGDAWPSRRPIANSPSRASNWLH